MSAKPADKKQNTFLQFALVFLLVYIVMQFFFPANKGEQSLPAPGLHLLTQTKSVSLGNAPILTLNNVPKTSESLGTGGWIQSKFCGLKKFFGSSVTAHECKSLAVRATGESATLPSRCPKPPVDVYRVTASGTTPVTADETIAPCEPEIVLEAGETHQLDLGAWKYSMFNEIGDYEAHIPEGVNSASGATLARFSVAEPGIPTKIFRTFVAAPLLNSLVFIASLLPGYSLGMAIILLTLAVKLLLFVPTQHAMEGQKKMQMLQPKLEELKKKYKGDDKRIQEETLKLWKEHKINPFQSCLPMLLQFPILIGLFYTIRDSATLNLSRHLLYGSYQDLPWSFGTNFLGLDLLKPEVYIFPIALVLLQFLQMKMSFAIQKRRKKNDTKSEEAPAPSNSQQVVMLYALPLMIGFFAIQFPAAVSLYWGISTLFAIGQQMIVNREHLRV